MNKNIELLESEKSLANDGKTFVVFLNKTKIGYVWKADGSWWANDKEYDESIEEFKTRDQGVKWLIDYVS
jgi:hypothetical protein